MELACNPSTAYNQTELSIDFTYYETADVPLKWWQKPFKWLADLFNGIPVEAKVILGTLFILASVALAFFSGGGSLVGEAMLGANAAALASAAQVGLIELTIGIGFSVAGWALSSAMNNSWSFDELTSSVIDGYFLTGVTFFISSSTNYLKFLSRIKPVTTVELKTASRVKDMSYNDMLPNEKAAYDGYSKHGWQGNYPGQQRGVSAGGRYQNKNGVLPNGTYHKFDINPAINGIGRDATRFVVSNDYVVYLTRDHYITFFRIIP